MHINIQFVTLAFNGIFLGFMGFSWNNTDGVNQFLKLLSVTLFFSIAFILGRFWFDSTHIELSHQSIRTVSMVFSAMLGVIFGFYATVDNHWKSKAFRFYCILASLSSLLYFLS